MDFKKESRNLYTLSELESARTRAAHADPRDVSAFKELEEIIFHSLRKPNLLRTQTVTGVALPAARLENRGLKDEAILKKLIQYRAQIPMSSRIIRKREP